MDSLTTLYRLAEKLNHIQRREVIMRMYLRAHGLTMEGIGKRHRLTKCYISGLIAGKFRWTARILALWEAELKVDLTHLLTEDEARRMGCNIEDNG